VIVLPDFAVKALRRQRKRKIPGALIFPAHNLKQRSRQNVNRQLREARKHVVRDRSGRPDGPANMFEWVTPHTMRRTVATIVAEQLGDEAAAGQLGHSSPTVTRKHYIDRRWANDVTSALDALSPVRSISDGYSMGDA